MPFNASGFFQRLFSWRNDRDAGIKILAERMDQEMDGIVEGINDIVSVNVDWKGPMTGVSGTAAAPAYSFSDDPDTGVYRSSTDVVSISAGAANQADFGSGGISLSNTVNFRTGYVYSYALDATTNSHYFLSDEDGQQTGVFYWDRTTNQVMIAQYNAGLYGSDLRIASDMISLATNATVGGSLTVTGASSLAGNMTIDTSWPTLALHADGDTDAPQIHGFSGGVIRWSVVLGNSSANKDFSIQRYNSAGTYQATSFQIDNANGRVFVNEGLTVSSNGISNYGPMAATGAITIDDGSTGQTILREGGGIELQRAGGWAYADWGDNTTDFLVRIQQNGSENRLNFHWHQGGYSDIRVRDVIADRNNNTGVIYLNGAQSRFLQFDGTNYVLPGADLWVNSAQVVTNNGATWGINISGSAAGAGNVGGYPESSLTKRDSTNGDAQINRYAYYTSWGARVGYLTGNVFEYHWNAGFFYRIDSNAWTLINASASDAKYKDIQPFSGDIFDDVTAVKPIVYEAKTDIPVALPQGVRDGFSAQELQALSPSLVKETPVPYVPEYERDQDGEFILDANGKQIKKNHPLENETFLALSEDAELQLISKLWRAVSELIERERARSGSASPIVDDSRSPTATDVKAEMRRRRRMMLGVETDDDVQDIVIEGTQEAVRLLRVGTTNWTAEQASRAAELEAFEASLAALAAKSREIQALTPVPADYANDARWA